ncbi:MAG: glycosyltransferase [Chitinophagaceae bacterium]|nr:MAG: glycosyltransferase [Chitinophagaceae bacterium]
MKTNQPIPVLHIIKSLGRGGAETLLPETLIKHDQHAFQFHYIYFIPWKDQMVGAIKAAGGVVTAMPAGNNLSIMAKIPAIVKYVRKHNIRLIHCHLPWAGITGRIVGKLTGVPVVYTEHNLWERYHKLTYHLNKITYSSQERVIAVSAEVAASIRNNHHKNKPHVQVVLNGINTEKFRRTGQPEVNIRTKFNIPAQAILIGITCVFRAQKRLTTWLEIAHALHQKFPDVHFIIIGDGVLKDEIHAKAAALNTNGYVHFAGLQTEIRPYLETLDIFMMSSEFEGLPIALLEAMSMEVMPACTNAGGISELVKDEINGIVVPVASPMLLVSRLEPYLADVSKIREMGRHARATVIADFSMEKMVGELEQIYRETLKQPS